MKEEKLSDVVVTLDTPEEVVPRGEPATITKDKARAAANGREKEESSGQIQYLNDLHQALMRHTPSGSFQSNYPSALVESLASFEKRLGENFTQCLTDGGSRKAMAKMVKLPKIDKTRWIAINILEQLRLINLLFLAVSEECTTELCPEMFVQDGQRQEGSCEEYMKDLNQWVSGLMDQGAFPSQSAYSKKVFVDYVHQIQRKSFRVFSHVHYAHWKLLQVRVLLLFGYYCNYCHCHCYYCCVIIVIFLRLTNQTKQKKSITQLFKVVYSYVWHFNTEFKLLDKKVNAPTLSPMDDMTRQIKDSKGPLL